MCETSDNSRSKESGTPSSGLPVNGPTMNGRALLLVLSVFVLLAGCASQREIFNESVIKRVGLPANTDAFRNRWYAGAAVGLSLIHI